MKRRPNHHVSSSNAPAGNPWVVIGVCVALVVLTWLVFGQTLSHDFVNYDDQEYVTKNAQVSRGLTLEGIGWAFTHFHSSNWHPLTWISHMIDCQLYGLNPWGHHLTNLLFHTANAILLFLVLRQMTGTLWPGAFVAALFALHPLRVESVAWVSERKDVLSGLFFIVTLMAYLRYVRAPSRSRYVFLAVSFALGLMSKPMLVSVPLVLLFLDHWPLRRLPSLSLADRENRKILGRLVLEKAPLFLLSLGSCLVTLFAQRGSMRPVAQTPWPYRLGNTAVSYLDYVWQTIWPRDLAVLYPWHTERLQPWNITLGAMFLLGVTLAVIALRRRRYLPVGWFWYVVMLIPVIGILQVGNQSHADRYTYLPSIGLYLMLVWSAVELAARWRYLLIPFAALGCGIAIALALVARTQASTWQDSETLWRHALAATTGNIIAEGNLGLALHGKGKNAEALEHFENSIRINRHQPAVLSSLGAFYLQMGRTADSISHLQEALEIEPKLEDAHYNLANTYLALGKANEALIEYQRALELEPDDIETLNNMAWILATWPGPSIRDGIRAVTLAERADSLTRRRNQIIAATLAAAYAEAGRFPEAVRAAERAIQLASGEGNSGRVMSIRVQLEAYKSGNAFRDDRFLGR